MANIRAIVKRRKAVRNIRKITRTMELIATARFKKAMDRATDAAAYTKKIGEIVADLSQTDLDFEHPLLKTPDKEEHATLLVITSNRGLCGGYNAGVIREGLGRAREIKDAGQTLHLEVAGKRGINLMKFRGFPAAETYTHFDEKVTFEQVDELASRFVDSFVEGKTHRVDVAYMQFESASRQTAVLEQLLPIGKLASEDDAGGNEAKIDYEFLPTAEDILQEIVPASFKARLFKCFLDAAVSEQIARMVAMKGATENADEMIGTLSMQYNRARQASITSELAEIIGGAAALE